METLNPPLTQAEKNWRAKARCVGFDTNEFFPAKGVNSRFIKEFCHECPVARECLDFALDNFLEHGVWGGTSPDERSAIRNGRKAHPYATVRR